MLAPFSTNTLILSLSLSLSLSLLLSCLFNPLSFFYTQGSLVKSQVSEQRCGEGSTRVLSVALSFLGRKKSLVFYVRLPRRSVDGGRSKET